MIIPENLKIIKRANFSEITNIKNILKEIIEMSPEKRYNIIKKDCDKLQKSSSIIWIKDLLCQLKKIFLNNKNKERIGEGYGMDFIYNLIPKSFTRLQENLDGNYNNDNISISDSYMDYNKKILNILNELSLDKNNKICLFTNESKDIFKEILLNPDNFYFVAEDGLVTKSIGEQNFKNRFTCENNWKNPFIKLFKNFINKTGVGYIIIKEYSVSWNYEDNEKGEYLLGNELKFLMSKFVDNKKFDIILNSNNLEVKIKHENINKYEYIDEMIKEDKNLKLIFALNNSDKSGDEFFDYLHNKKRCINDNFKNINLITTIIGKKASKANYYLKDIYDFINIFNMKNI